MTIEQKIGNMLLEHGLWADEAAAVISSLKDQEESMRGRWNEPTESYPESLLVVLWISAKAAAVRWIDDNKPAHFARALLAG